MMLVPIAPPEFDIDLAIAYASADNFTGAPVYRRAAAYLNPEAAGLLAKAIELTRAQGLRLKLFDAFRPSEAQWRLWSHTPDPGFLADPRRGSPHSRGAAVDLTLVDARGRELDMGTRFDAFTPLSHHGAAVAPEPQRNRMMLLGLMTAAGWDYYRNEWWHYQLFNPRRFPLLSDSVLSPGLM